MAAASVVGPPPRARGQPLGAQVGGPPHRSTPACAGTTRRPCGRAPPVAVHPRVRGDNGGLLVSLQDVLGPPPRARGQRNTELTRRAGARSTPACAGTTCSCRPAAPPLTVHPRVRGDNSTAAPGDEPVDRSTPACAETTSMASTKDSCCSVHPRVRGDNARVMRSPMAMAGPPPRARGQRGRGDGRGVRLRSTPACAGTTTAPLAGSTTVTVHPRVRGDNVPTSSAARRRIGPPPRARGQQRAEHFAKLAERSTPACAGTTNTARPSRRSAPVHPRVRGDNATRCRPASKRTGPPPRARGQRDRCTGGRSRERSTPACAGTTTSECRAAGPTAVHPRVRGDNGSLPGHDDPAGGPPPRARGQRTHVIGREKADRSTPACAGTTAGRALRQAGRTVHPRVRGDN